MWMHMYVYIHSHVKTNIRMYLWINLCSYLQVMMCPFKMAMSTCIYWPLLVATACAAERNSHTMAPRLQSNRSQPSQRRSSHEGPTTRNEHLAPVPFLRRVLENATLVVMITGATLTTIIIIKAEYLVSQNYPTPIFDQHNVAMKLNLVCHG